MSLNLISMFIYATEKVGSPVHIKHDSPPLVCTCTPLSIVPSRFNPFGLQFAAFSSPLPPRLPSNFIDATMSQLSYDGVRSLRNTIFGYCDLINFDPARTWYPLRRKSLKIFDCVMRGIGEKLADEVQTLMV